MTAPASQTDLQALLEEHAQLILAIEVAASAAATAALVKQLGRIQRNIAAAWISAVGTLTNIPTPNQARTLTKSLIAALRGIRVSVSASITPFAGRAAGTAQRQARAEVGAPPPDELAGVSTGLEQVIADADAAVQDRIDTAIDTLAGAPPEDWGQVLDVLSAANQSRGAAERAAAWAVNAAANQAVVDEAAQLDAQLLWVAERDACVHCLAYSGVTAAPGQSFPLGRTYGDKPSRPWPDPDRLPGPPLHPRCRCRLMLWFGHDTAAAVAALPVGARSAHVSFPDALRREADRSILRGFSLPSESARLRLRAAERLLSRGVRAPKTVKQYARAAIRRGGWPSRRVPTPPP